MEGAPGSVPYGKKGSLSVCQPPRHRSSLAEPTCSGFTWEEYHQPPLHPFPEQTAIFLPSLCLVYQKLIPLTDSLKSLPQITDPAVETNIPIVLQTKRNYRGSAGGHGASKSGAETDVSVEVISAEESSKPEKPTSPAPTSPLSKCVFALPLTIRKKIVSFAA